MVSRGPPDWSRYFLLYHENVGFQPGVPHKPFQIFALIATEQTSANTSSLVGVGPKFCSLRIHYAIYLRIHYAEHTLRNIFCPPVKNRNFRASCDKAEIYGILQPRLVPTRDNSFSHVVNDCLMMNAIIRMRAGNSTRNWRERRSDGHWDDLKWRWRRYCSRNFCES
jgi:hypothetical protein